MLLSCCCPCASGTRAASAGSGRRNFLLHDAYLRTFASSFRGGRALARANPEWLRETAVPQTGFLLIADITGYTMFLTRSELEHAQGILDTLFKSIFAEIKAPIILSNLQGDAALTHLPDVNLPQRQFPLDAIERIYCSFSQALGAMRVNTTCTCNACRNMNQLDLKFFLHHGIYATQQMAGRTELQGPEVIRLHRLMKNSVTAATGLKA